MKENVQPNELESHRMFIDVRVPLDKFERVLVANASLKNIKKYNIFNDVEFFTSDYLSEIIVHPGQFLVSLPGEAHSPARIVDKPGKLKKLYSKFHSLMLFDIIEECLGMQRVNSVVYIGK